MFIDIGGGVSMRELLIPFFGGRGVYWEIQVNKIFYNNMVQHGLNSLISYYYFETVCLYS